MARPKKQNDESYIPQELGGFDPKIVHHRDPHTGQLVKVNPFRVIIDNGVRFYEWPKGSGNLWWENRTFAGRLDERGRPVRGKAHEKYAPPLTMDQKIAQHNMVLEQENKKLAAELQEIKQERALDESHPKEPAKGFDDVTKDKDEATGTVLAKS